MFEILDSPEYTEQLLRHLVRDPSVVAKANDLGIKDEDFLSSAMAGIRLYKEFANIALKLQSAPIDMSLFGLHVKERMRNGELASVPLDQIARLMSFVYSGTLHTEYVVSTMRDWVKRRRQAKAHFESGQDLDVLTKKLNQIAVELDCGSSENGVTRIINPFDGVIRKPITTRIGTGLHELDAVIGGWGFGEYYLCLGYSGGGKSLTGLQYCKAAALQGFKSVYFTLEEPYYDVIQRIYSSTFELSYSALHQGQLGMELEDAMRNMDPIQKELLSNIRIVDLRDKAPVTTRMLERELELLADAGFVTDLVVTDQTDYLTSWQDSSLNGWELLTKVNFEYDAFTHHKIGGVKPIAGILNHQVNGKMKEFFTREEINGLKSMDKPTDGCFGYGRVNQMSDEINIFSLKSRHSKNFAVKYKVDFEHMRFVEKISFKQFEKPQEEQLSANPQVQQWTQ